MAEFRLLGDRMFHPDAQVRIFNPMGKDFSYIIQKITKYTVPSKGEIVLPGHLADIFVKHLIHECYVSSARNKKELEQAKLMKKNYYAKGDKMFDQVVLEIREVASGGRVLIQDEDTKMLEDTFVQENRGDDTDDDVASEVLGSVKTGLSEE